MQPILILGGYGNFGKRISLALAKSKIPIIIAGRNKNQAQALSSEIHHHFPNTSIATACFDVNTDLDQQLKQHKPVAVVNTCGPFQTTDYRVAEQCIAHGVHYIDLADGRDFVTGITTLHESALAQNTLVVSGASTVPSLSSAVLDHFQHEFSTINSLIFGISPGQKAPRGIATTQAILSYTGKKLPPCAGNTKRYGWQGLYRQQYPELGNRWMADCDVPDLDLLPKRYDIRSIRFSAGMESTPLHLGIWLLSWVIRAGIPLNLPRHASFLLKASNWFNWLGSDNGGMHIIIRGTNPLGGPYERKWFIIAKHGDGPQIPTIPAIILAKRIAQNKEKLRGAHPCIGLVSLEEYLTELSEFSITTHTQ